MFRKRPACPIQKVPSDRPNIAGCDSRDTHERAAAPAPERNTDRPSGPVPMLGEWPRVSARIPVATDCPYVIGCSPRYRHQRAADAARKRYDDVPLASVPVIGERPGTSARIVVTTHRPNVVSRASGDPIEDT